VRPGVLAAGALLLSLLGRVGSADALRELERAVHAAVRARGEARQEQAARRAEALTLADEIAQEKDASGGVRAGGALEQRLRAFDRVALALDELDRKVEAAEVALQRAQRAFAAAAAAASGVDADEARARVRAATEAPAFRPPLEVHKAPEDGPVETQGKLQLLDAERRRIAEELGGLDAEDLVLAERVAMKRRLAQELGVSRRDAGPALALLGREAEDLRRGLARLTREREELARARALRRDALHDVDAMVREIKGR
jgi:hypothetical protein